MVKKSPMILWSKLRRIFWIKRKPFSRKLIVNLFRLLICQRRKISSLIVKSQRLFLDKMAKSDVSLIRRIPFSSSKTRPKCLRMKNYNLWWIKPNRQTDRSCATVAANRSPLSKSSNSASIALRQIVSNAFIKHDLTQRTIRIRPKEVPYVLNAIKSSCIVMPFTKTK